MRCLFVFVVTATAVVASILSASADETPRLPGRIDLPEPDSQYAFAVDRPAFVKGGRTYSPFYSYVITPHAIVEQGKVFCTFQNREGRPIVAAYDIQEKKWSDLVKASEFGLGSDAHGNPSICIDTKGHLHVFYGCHGDPMRHTRSTGPYDVTEWEEQPSPTPRATYPQSMRMADGSICLFYRAGGHMEPWSLRVSTDDCRTWSPAERVIEMRLDPPDRLAAAYCNFFPGSDGRTIHCFWNHKDDNAARVTDTNKHPWRPLKYKGLHEAVYRYNVYYVRRDPRGVWRNAQGEAITLPISKATADAKCLVYDSGDEFTFVGGTRLAVDDRNRPYLNFKTGVVDWARVPKRTLVPMRRKYAYFAADRWQVEDRLPDDCPAGAREVLSAYGLAAYGGPAARGWYIFFDYESNETGPSLFLYHDRVGYATRPGGAAEVP